MQTSPGQIAWIDLTVRDAINVKEFYSAGVGWTASPVSMGECEDFTMLPAEGSEPVAGICHARGSNASLPPMWLPYFIVTDLETSVKNATRLGGQVILGPNKMGDGSWCVVRDPAGAVAAVMESGKSS